MFYVFPYSVQSTDTSASKHREDLDLIPGVIHQVDILFQDGCAHQAHVQIFHGKYQAWPGNRGKSFRGNATVISFREFYELESMPANLYAKIWGDGVIDDVEVVIQIGLLDKKIIQPLSFDELLAAAAGIK